MGFNEEGLLIFFIFFIDRYLTPSVRKHKIHPTYCGLRMSIQQMLNSVQDTHPVVYFHFFGPYSISKPFIGRAPIWASWRLNNVLPDPRCKRPYWIQISLVQKSFHFSPSFSLSFPLCFISLCLSLPALFIAGPVVWYKAITRAYVPFWIINK